MEDCEVRLLWIQLLFWNAESKKSISDQIAAARASRPDHPEVLYWSALYERAWGKREEARSLLERASQAQPNDTRIWSALVNLELSEVSGLPMADRRAGPALEQLKRHARTASELNNVAWYLSEIGKPMEALPYAVQAVDKAPGCFNCRDTMAQILFQSGKVERAIEEQRIALNLLPEGATELRKTFGDRLSRYAKAAAQPSPSRP